MVTKASRSKPTPDHLLDLSARVAETANDPRYVGLKNMWTRHNRLEKVEKTPVYVCLKRGDGANANPVTWTELIPRETRISSDPLEADIELQLRQKLYKHDHIPDDEVLVPTVWINPVRPTTDGDDSEAGGGGGDFEGLDAKSAARLWGLGFNERRTGGPGNAYAVEPTVITEDDLEKLKRPRYQVDEEATLERIEQAKELVGDRLPIKLRYDEISYAPTETMISLMGMEQVLFGVYDRPDFMHRIMNFITDATIEYHLEREAMGAIDSEQTWGYRMPYEEVPEGTNTNSLALGWATIAAQSMCGLSPAMYEEFVQPYHERMAKIISENRIYYHGCEDLTAKIPIISQLSNLRRFHISPWTNVKIASELLERNFVMEIVGHPDTLHVQTEQEMRDWLTQTMDIAGDNILDLNLGEIETTFNNPAVLTTWSEIAQDVAEQYA